MSARTALLRSALVAAAALALLGVAGPPAAAGGTGPQYVDSPGVVDTDPTKSWFVTCPRGTVALSGGAFLIGDTAGVHLDLLRPALDGTLFEAAASTTADRRGSGEWGLIVYGICAPRPAGLVYVEPAQSVSYDSPLRTALATCPAGKRLVGFGGRAAVEPSRNVALHAMLPSVQLDRVVVQSWALEGGEPADWTAEAYAVCADPLPGAVMVVTTAGPDSIGSKVTGAACPAAQHVHAVGGAIFNAAGQAWLPGLYPSADLHTATAIAVEDPTGYVGNWFLNAYAICA
jgi:hypothetical protein